MTVGTILYIKANAKPEGISRTFRVSDSFVETYKNSHPGDNVVELDLYKEDIAFLTEEDINTVFGPKTEESRKHRILKYSYQFAKADKYVIAEPMWNLGIPAILKAYIDYITVTGITFKYTETGPVGLLKGKKAVNISARGGDYHTEPYSNFEMGDRYLRTIFTFLGVTDFTTITAENLDVVGQDVDAVVNAAIKRAKEFAGTF
jgi:FMN-dependent NADH-azoreductase